MKKIFFSIFAVAALALTSCAGGAGSASILDIDASTLDNETEKCWEYTTYCTQVAGTEVVAYVWCTEKVFVETQQDVVKAANEAAAAVGYTYNVTYKESAAEDAVACLEKN